MLPSVSAGSAALTKYAQALAMAAPDAASGDPDGTPRAEQEAARQNAGQTPVAHAAPEKLAREARDTARALMNLLRSRVFADLIDIDIPEPVARKAADAAVAQLAASIAGDGQHAVQIVQSVLDRMSSATPDSANLFLNIAAKGLTVTIDRETGDVQVHLPRLDIVPGAAPEARTAPHHKLVDVTDNNTERAAPIFEALREIQAVARDVAPQRVVPSDNTATLTRGTPVIIAPNAFVQPLTDVLNTTMPASGSAQTIVVEAAQTVSALLARVATMASQVAPQSAHVSVAEIAQTIQELRPVTVVTDTNSQRLVLGAGNMTVSVDLQNAATTVQVGNRIVGYAPTSAAASVAKVVAIPGLETAPLPTRDIPSSLPAGTVPDRPVGTPFVPPPVTDIPLTTPPATPAPAQTRAPAPANAQVAKQMSDPLSQENLRHLDPAVLRNATVLRGIETPTASDRPSLTRITLDISAEFAPGVHSPATQPLLGKFGLPQKAPEQAPQNGPVRPDGYTDAASRMVPVLPAVHARGELPAPAIRKREKKKQKRLPTHAYTALAIDDAMTRETPSGHQGLVFSSVVFSI